jgi:hypothetical protein
VFPPAKAVLSAIDIMLSVRLSLVISALLPFHLQRFQAAKDVRESYDNLVNVFECIEGFLRRLSIYNEIQTTPAMAEMVVKIMAEIITVLALATKQLEQGRFSMSAPDC